MTGSHPLLQQTPLSVNPFIDLPKPPTLPHNYASLPSTLPPSSINAPPAPSNPDLPAYVTSSSGFAAHPSSIIAQNEALLKQIEQQARNAGDKIRGWEKGIENRELAEKRKKAPGWLDSNERMLEPEKAGRKEQINLMDEPEPDQDKILKIQRDKEMNDLGAAMDKAFG